MRYDEWLGFPLELLLAAATFTACLPDPDKLVDRDGDGADYVEDCDDGDAEAHPGGAEVWYDGVDQDCSGGSDHDQDGDGYDDATTLSSGTDCDDLDATTSPGADELCDGVDNDCDGLVDDDDDGTLFPTYYADQDADGYGDPARSTPGTSCEARHGYVSNADDCDDDDPSVNPGAPEVCDEIDNDCDGDVDVDATDAATWCQDADEDGFGDPTAATAQACLAPDGYVAEDACTDCDDSSVAIYPNEDLAEACDEIDNDCDGEVDEAEDELDGEICYVDADLDGWGTDEDPNTIRSCACPEGYAEVFGDCDDDRADVNPDQTERCDADEDTRVDEDCDGLFNEGDPSLPASETTSWYPDEDADTYGASGGADYCWPPEDYVANADDCDDSSPTRYPGAPPICDDDLVNDCDGSAEDEIQDCIISMDSTVVLSGSSADDTLGSTLAHLGDVTGDGLADAGVAAIGATSGKGTLYLLQGASELTDVTFSDIAATSLLGVMNSDALGMGVAGLGDLDGDGYAEIAVSAPYSSSSDRGTVYIVSGPLTAGVSTASSAAAQSFTGDAYYDGLGTVLSAEADWDEDGVADLAASAPGSDSGATDAGAVYLITATTSATKVNYAAYATLTGADTSERAGSALASLGDTDGDGIDDLAIGAPDNDDRATGGGVAYVVLGPIAFDNDLDASDYYLYGASASAAAGSALGAADLDDDGLNDVLVGAPGADTAYVLFGSTSFTAGAYLTSADITLSGASSGDEAGASVAGAGDVDGDGGQDLLVGAPANDDAGADAGAAYLLFGPLSTATLDLSADADITWTGDGAGDGLGATLAGGGDLDDNGYPDLLLGAPAADDGGTTDAGATWLIRGGY